MRISELISLLNEYQDKWGDLPVYVASGPMLEFYDPDFNNCSLVLAHDKRNDDNPEQDRLTLSPYEYAVDDDPDNYYRAVELVPPEYRAETILGLWIDYED